MKVLYAKILGNSRTEIGKGISSIDAESIVKSVTDRFKTNGGIPGFARINTAALLEHEHFDLITIPYSDSERITHYIESAFIEGNFLCLELELTDYGRGVMAGTELSYIQLVPSKIYMPGKKTQLVYSFDVNFVASHEASHPLYRVKDYNAWRASLISNQQTHNVELSDDANSDF